MKKEKIHIVESHEQVLLPWSRYRQQESIAPILLTMDHHTDLHDAFLGKILRGKDLDYQLQERLIARTNFMNISSINQAVEDIKNDEQIQTALKTDIISSAFVIAYDAGPGNQPKSQEELEDDRFFKENRAEVMLGLKCYPEHKRPYHYSEPNEKIYVPDWDRLARVTDEGKDCFVDFVIDDSFLIDIFATFGDMSKRDFIDVGKFSRKYILDIDLDYFSSKESLSPVNTKIFYNLIRDADLITIAKEPLFVEMCSQETMTADEVLNKLMEHIELALRDR